ncbi:MAG TPA: helix-turn-helix domain-containing protein [Conexivisphaerales archaeon]|nr:helix-turn-helix domain-containing protein [Conexivisphaerales archaeon]
MKEAVISIKMHGVPTCPIIRLGRGLASLRGFRVSSDGRGFLHFIEVYSPKSDASKVIKEIGKAEGIREMDVAYVGKEKAMAQVVSAGCPMCKTAHSSGCFIMGASSRPLGEVEWQVLLPRGQTVKQILDGFAEVGLEARLASVQQLKRSGRMTSRQLEVLRRGLAVGYFDVPRRIGVKRFAKIVGVAPSTLDETIRRGEKNVLEEYLKSWKGV